MGRETCPGLRSSVLTNPDDRVTVSGVARYTPAGRERFAQTALRLPFGMQLRLRLPCLLYLPNLWPRIVESRDGRWIVYKRTRALQSEPLYDFTFLSPHFFTFSLNFLPRFVHMTFWNVLSLPWSIVLFSARTLHDQFLSSPQKRKGTYECTIGTDGARRGSDTSVTGSTNDE